MSYHCTWDFIYISSLLALLLLLPFTRTHTVLSLCTKWTNEYYFYFYNHWHSHYLLIIQDFVEICSWCECVWMYFFHSLYKLNRWCLELFRWFCEYLVVMESVGKFNSRSRFGNWWIEKNSPIILYTRSTCTHLQHQQTVQQRHNDKLMMECR